MFLQEHWGSRRVIGSAQAYREHLPSLECDGTMLSQTVKSGKVKREVKIKGGWPNLSHGARDFRGRTRASPRVYGCYVTGYVVMLEHVHLLISEPEARRREQMGVALVARAHPPAKSAGRVGQPSKES